MVVVGIVAVAICACNASDFWHGEICCCLRMLKGEEDARRLFNRKYERCNVVWLSSEKKVCKGDSEVGLMMVGSKADLYWRGKQE